MYTDHAYVMIMNRVSYILVDYAFVGVHLG